MSKRMSIEQTLEYKIAHAAPQTEEEREFIDKYRLTYEQWLNRNESNESALTQKLNILGESSIAKTIFLREWKREGQEAQERYNKQLQDRLDSIRNETPVEPLVKTKKIDNGTKIGVTISVILGFLFFISVFDLEYGYYQFVRVFAFIMTTICAIILLCKGGFSVAHIPLIAIWILWNPIDPFYMEKSTWVVFDIIAAICEFVIAGYMYFKTEGDG